MKNLIFGFLAITLISFSVFASNFNEKSEITLNDNFRTISSIVEPTNPCASCPDDCCAIIINLPNGGTRTIKTCCSNISVIKL